MKVFCDSQNVQAKVFATCVVLSCIDTIEVILGDCCTSKQFQLLCPFILSANEILLLTLWLKKVMNKSLENVKLSPN